MSTERSWSLTVTVAVYTAAVMVVGMTIYGVFQYFLSPGHTVVGLILEHLSHVLVLGVLIYGMLNLVLHKKVVRPINALYFKLYSFAGGDFRPASVDSDIFEIKEIAEGINLMLAKIDRSRPEVSLEGLSHGAGQLRDLAQQSGQIDTPTREMLQEVARKIDSAVEAVTVYALDQEAAGREGAAARRPASGDPDRQLERLAV